jgi:hypothetical protein
MPNAAFSPQELASAVTKLDVNEMGVFLTNLSPQCLVPLITGIYDVKRLKCTELSIRRSNACQHLNSKLFVELGFLLYWSTRRFLRVKQEFSEPISSKVLKNSRVAIHSP